MTFHKLAIAALCGFFAGGVVQAAGPTTLWIEGESAVRPNVQPHSSWYDKVKKNTLSGGDWLHHFSPEKEGTADYPINVPEAGRYRFWVRANPTQSKLSYQLGDGPWTPIALDKNNQDVINIAADDKPDLRFIGWTEVGALTLPKGVQTLRFKMHSTLQNHGGLDAFVLTTQVFVPNGAKKPDEKTTLSQFAPDDTWPFTYSKDPFTPDALLDLRTLNEQTAGEKGFVRLTPDGNDFALGDGKPVRFWAVNTTVYRQEAEDLERHARFLAKIGVNLVRMHGSISPKGEGKRITDVDEAEIDRCWRLVAAMKKQGIYTTISPFWANGGHAGTAASWNLEGYGDKADLWGLMFFDDSLQRAYKTWVKALYTRPNPYTGVALRDDPAVAIVQVKNEDSLLFWTTQGMKPVQLERLGQKFGQWLVQKYGSLQAAKTAWGGASHAKDDFAANKVGIWNVWEMTQPQQGPKAKRVRDELQFFAETQRAFYADIANYYRNELGCKQLINANNWTTADPVKLGDIERWTYTAADVLAVNKYYNGGPHLGSNNGWRIDPGHFFEGRSALRNPLALPTNLKQVAGHPHLITESTWVNPLGYQSEGPFLMAAYQSLTGVDAFYWFSADTPAFNLDPYIPWANLSGGQKPLHKWPLFPAVQSGFPAAALMYRRGYLQPGATVVHEERSLENLWDRTTPLLTKGKTFDPNRDKTNFAEGSAVKTPVDPLAFLVGRVEVRYNGDPANNKVADLSRFIDPAKKTVTSTTGEIRLNYETGVCIVNAPKVQGVTGFLSQAGTIQLRDVAIRSGNDYATIFVVALDDKPLGSSRKILVQVGTPMRPTGWTTEQTAFPSEDGKTTYQGHRIVSTGKMPWRVVKADVTLTLKNPELRKATALDTAGYAKGAVQTTVGETFQLTLSPDTLYVVLE